MKTVDEMILDIIRIEKGYNDVIDDKGGATNLGISLRYLKGKGLLVGDLDHDGDVDKDDIRLVDVPTARKLYKNDFYFAPGIERLPSEIQPQMFDISVNSGPSRAVGFAHKILHQLTGWVAPASETTCGYETQEAATACIKRFGPAVMNNTLVELRKAHYRDIIANDPSQQKFMKGWETRADSFKV